MSLKEKIHVNTHYTRSINLERDADSLHVLNAYIPTSRALRLFTRVSEGFNNKQVPRAWSLIGPYGSGKSASSVFLSHLLSSPDLKTTNVAIENLKNTDTKIAKLFQKETTDSHGYLKVLITGSPEAMGKNIVEGFYESAKLFFRYSLGPKPKILAKFNTLSKKEN